MSRTLPSDAASGLRFSANGMLIGESGAGGHQHRAARARSFDCVQPTPTTGRRGRALRGPARSWRVRKRERELGRIRRRRHFVPGLGVTRGPSSGAGRPGSADSSTGVPTAGRLPRPPAMGAVRTAPARCRPGEAPARATPPASVASSAATASMPQRGRVAGFRNAARRICSERAGANGSIGVVPITAACPRSSFAARRHSGHEARW